MPERRYITRADGRAGGSTPPQGADLLTLARVVAAARAPSGVLLAAFIEAARAQGRSLERLARKAGVRRQAVARWIAGSVPRKRRARLALQSFARELLGPLEGSIMQVTANVPTLEERLTRSLASSLGWPPYEEALPPAPPDLVLRTPENVVARAAQLAGMPLAVLTGPSREGTAVAARVAAARVLRAMGWPHLEVGNAIGRSYHTVLYLLNERAGGRCS